MKISHKNFLGDLKSPRSVLTSLVNIYLDDNKPGSIIENGGTLELNNSGDVEADCDADIDVEIDENFGTIINEVTILMKNTGDSTSKFCDETSFITLEYENDGDNDSDEGLGKGETLNSGFIHLLNEGNADEISVILKNDDAGTTLNNVFLKIENKGDAADELQVGIDNRSPDTEGQAFVVFNNECGAVIEIINPPCL